MPGLSSLEQSTNLKMLLIGPPKVGKAQPITEPVLTPSGWRAMGDLVVGDYVIGSDGKPTRVVGVYPQGRKAVCRVTTDDGAWTLASEDHLWFTTTKTELKRGRWSHPHGPHSRRTKKVCSGEWGEGSVKTTAEIAASLNPEQNSGVHYLPRISAPVKFDSRPPLGFDPYFVGLLIGDGSFTTGMSFTSMDDELLRAVSDGAAALGDIGRVRVDEDHCPVVNISGMNTKRLLADLGLYGHRSETKFVPPAVFNASPEERLMFLRGLCDTDGSAVRRENAEGFATQAEFSSTSEALANGVVEIVRSLGGRARVRMKETSCQTGPGLPAYVVLFCLSDGECPFKLKRKADVWRIEKKRDWRQRIESIESVGEWECVCIRVEAEDSLYVTRNFLLTHNSSAAILTAPYPMRVLLCEDTSALQYALIVMRDEMKLSTVEINKRVDYEMVDTEKAMLTEITRARADAEAGKLKTLIIDPLTFYAERLLDECFLATRTQDNKNDGRRAHPEMTTRLRKMIYQLLRLPCHVIIVCHYLDIGDAAKVGGEGKVPMLPNKEARTLVHAMVPNTVWMDVRGEKRAFVTAPKGASGPGCRGWKGAAEIEADVGELMRGLGLGGAPAARTNGAVKPPIKTSPQHQPQLRK